MGRMVSNLTLTFLWQIMMHIKQEPIPMETNGMAGIEIEYLFGGLLVLIGSIAFLKIFDFIAAQSAKRLLDLAKGEPN